MREAKPGLEWQSKAILLIVVPWTAICVLLQSWWWAREAPVVVWTTLGISGVFGLVVWRLRAGTLGAAATGAAITASLMYSTTRYSYPYSWMHGGLSPLLAVFLLTFIATKIGKSKKDRLGTGENKRGRNSAQVAANLGAAALIAQPRILAIPGSRALDTVSDTAVLLAIAILAEAAADTVSSEIGQVFGGQPRLLTTLSRVEPGADGGITLAGSAAGAIAAAIVAAIGVWALGEDWFAWTLCTAGAVLGLFFDSLLGATIERKGWLNNDAVNFLSTLSAPIFAVLFMLSYFFLFGKNVI